MNQEQKGFMQWYNQLVDGLRDGIAASPEDRRENLTAIREIEGKAEAPRGMYTLFQNPVIDAVRQRNTVRDLSGVAALGLPQFTDESIVYRANQGLMVGPSPEELVPEKFWVGNQALPVDPKRGKPEPEAAFKDRLKSVRTARERNLQIYKHKLAETPALTKAGQALGALGADISQDTSRGLWWLLNASQAVVNLGQESISAAVNPDLFGARPLTDLPAAEKQGLLRYIHKAPTQQSQNLVEPLADVEGTAASARRTGDMEFLADQLIEEEKTASSFGSSKFSHENSNSWSGTSVLTLTAATCLPNACLSCSIKSSYELCSYNARMKFISL